MRYKDRVVFIVAKVEKYNPISKKKETEKKYYEELPCNINALSRERVKLEFGESYKDITIVRLPHAIDFVPTHAMIRDIDYKVVNVRKYDEHVTSVFLSEVVY